MLLEKEHDILHFLLPLPALRYHPDTLVPDPRYFNQKLYVVLDDGKGIHAVFLNDLSGVFRTNPFNQAAAEVFFHPVYRGRKRLLPFLCHKLTAIFRIHLPFPVHQKHGTHIGIQKIPHHGDQVVIAFHMNLQN